MLLPHPLHASAHTTCASQDTLLGAFCHVGGSAHVELNSIASFTIADIARSHCVFLHFAIAHGQNKLRVGTAARLFRRPVQTAHRTPRNQPSSIGRESREHALHIQLAGRLPGTPCRSRRHQRQDTLLGAFCTRSLPPCNKLSPESHINWHPADGWPRRDHLLRGLHHSRRNSHDSLWILYKLTFRRQGRYTLPAAWVKTPVLCVVCCVMCDV